MRANPGTAKRVIGDYWTWRSSTFDAHSSARQPEWWEIFEKALERPEPCRILDVGTGTGFLARGLAAAGHRLIGIDISPGMIALARRNVAGSGTFVDLLVADAEDPPFAPESFDAIVSRNLLWTLCRPEVTLRRWHRILRPGGRIVLSDGMWNHAGVKGRLRRLRQSTVRMLTQRKDPEVSLRFWSAYRPIHKSLPHFRGVLGEEAETLLRSSGFETPARYEHMFPTCPYSGNAKKTFFVAAAQRR